MNFRSKVLGAGILVTATLCAGTVSAQNNPTISLFPSTVKQDLKASVDATKRLEEGIQPIIAQMAETEELFRAAQCDGEAGDPGCAALKKQLQQQYLDMLTEVDEVLPEVETAIKSTHASLSKSITKTLGRTKTPYDLQHEFLKENKTIPDNIRGRKKGLSKRLEGLLRLTSQNSDPSTALVMASDFFLDANDSLEIITQTRAAIAQAKTQAALDLELGSLSDEMFATVDSVKGILDADDYETIPDDDALILEPEGDGGFDDSDFIY